MPRETVLELRNIAHNLIDSAVGKEEDPRGERRKAVYEWLAGQCGDAAGYTNGRRGTVHLRYMFTEEECRHIIGLLLLLFKEQKDISVDDYLAATPYPSFDCTAEVQKYIAAKKLLTPVRDLASTEASRVPGPAYATAAPSVSLTKKKKKKKTPTSQVLEKRSDRLIRILDDLLHKDQTEYTPEALHILGILREIALTEDKPFMDISDFITSHVVEKHIVDTVERVERKEYFEVLYGAFTLFENAMLEKSMYSSSSSLDSRGNSSSESSFDSDEPRRRSSSGSSSPSSPDFQHRRVKAKERQQEKAAQKVTVGFNKLVQQQAVAEQEAREEAERARRKAEEQRERELQKEKQEQVLAQKPFKKEVALQSSSPSEDPFPAFDPQIFLGRLLDRQQKEQDERLRYRKVRNFQKAKEAYEKFSLVAFNRLNEDSKILFAQMLIEKQPAIYGEYKAQKLANSITKGSVILGSQAKSNKLESCEALLSEQYQWKIMKEREETLVLGFALITYDNVERAITIFKEQGINCIGFDFTSYCSPEVLQIKMKKRHGGFLDYDPPIGKEENTDTIHLFKASGDTAILEAISKQLYVPFQNGMQEGVVLIFTDAAKIYQDSVGELQDGNESPIISLHGIRRSLGWKNNIKPTVIPPGARSTLPCYEEVKEYLGNVTSAIKSVDAVAYKVAQGGATKS